MVVALIATACNNTCDDDCFISDSDFSGKVSVKLSTIEAYDSIRITLYEGDFEEGNAVFTILSDNSDRMILGEFKAGVSYSATARYYGPNSILAVDGKQMDAKTIDCDCPNGAENITLNLRLK